MSVSATTTRPRREVFYLQIGLVAARRPWSFSDMSGARYRTCPWHGVTDIDETRLVDARAAPEGIFITLVEEPGDGIPLAVKDLFDTAGLRTTYGSVIFADHVPAETASAVRLLEAAGYADVGKTNLHEFAYGVTSQNPHYGTVPNPRAPGRLAGGSSGGSAAALAAGLADAALGSDSGGSIRIPAAWCGIVGFKPTYGLVPIDGCFPLAPSFDHAGPMAGTVADCEAMMRALAPELAPVRLDAPEELEVGIAWTELCEPLVRARVDAAAGLFPRSGPVELPFPERVGRVFMREVAEVHSGLFPEHAELYGESVRARLERCFEVTDGQVASGLRGRSEYRERAEEAMAGIDLLLTPTQAFVAPAATVEEREIRDATIRFTFPFNVLGWPALALPCGPAELGLPASLQLVGRQGDDARVLAAGAWLEAQMAARTAAS
jgi:aspartyl-tRNA(Asn)/glutamyl-tRNA(Gln) amidotransferase subunit A